MSYADLFSDQDNRSDLGITLIGAALLHIVLILGLTFTLPKKQINDDPPQLEITLVQAHTEEVPEPEKADFLANATQQGGGDTEKELQAKTPLPGTAKKNKPQPRFRPPSEASEEVVTQTDKVLVAETT
ncbi:MAG: hypothetical protein WBN45_04610, partial [Arenicellales bacterium]